MPFRSCPDQPKRRLEILLRHALYEACLNDALGVDRLDGGDGQHTLQIGNLPAIVEGYNTRELVVVDRLLYGASLFSDKHRDDIEVRVL